MIEGHVLDKDGLIWSLKLRDGLRFHDNEPVLARDVVASIRRFAPRISFANALITATDELSAPDDYTVRFRLKRPFPHLPEALAGPGGTVPAIMPERQRSLSLPARRAYQRRPRRLRALCRIPAAGWPAWLYLRA
jgi:peptide/nickel transport system substrate-binding protein